jgi:hypothetical protein
MWHTFWKSRDKYKILVGMPCKMSISFGRSTCRPKWEDIIKIDVRFQVFMAACMKMTAFWENAPHSLVEVD